VVLLRVQHGYERPPGVTVARLLHNRRTPAWRPGLGEAARPAAAALLQALLGWTAGEPVPASEAFARDGPPWRQEADAGAAPVEEPAPSPQPAEPWEVEDGPTADGARVVEGAGERRARRRAGKAWRPTPGASHREAAGGPAYNARSRRARESDGGATDDGGGADAGNGGGGDGGGGGGSGGGDGSGSRGGGGGDGGGGQQRPLGNGKAELDDGEVSGERGGGEQRPRDAASSGGQAGGGLGTGAGGRGVRRRKHVGSRKREVHTEESADARTPQTPGD
jgi:hypothetical protein